MKILMLSDFETDGGAAIVAERLATALSRRGHSISRVVYGADQEPHSWSRYRLLPRNQLAYRTFRRSLSSPLADKADRVITRRSYAKILRRERPDVVNIHNLHGALDVGWSLDLVHESASNHPTVWSLHDMWSFTGRCAYSYDCMKFIEGCDHHCPTPHEYPSLEPALIAGAWSARKELLASHPNMVAVSSSRWLAQVASAGSWRSHEVSVIPYGLPLDVFRPTDGPTARNMLGIPSSGLVLLVAAADLADRRKGFHLFVEALRKASVPPLTLVTFGRGRPNVNIPGVTEKHLGFLEDDRKKAAAFSAADVYVHPAIAEAMGYVVMESLACGTPVLAFPVGGVVDMVRPSTTGWLATDVSSDALRSALEKAFRDLQAGLDLSKGCRRVAELEYGDDLMAERYETLFLSMIKGRVQVGFRG